VDDENPSCSVIHFLSGETTTTQARWHLSFSCRYPSGSEQAWTDSRLDPSSTCTDRVRKCSIRAWLVTSHTDDVRVLYVLRIVGCLFRERKPFAQFCRTCSLLTNSPSVLTSTPYRSFPFVLRLCISLVFNDIVLSFRLHVVDAYNCIGSLYDKWATGWA